MKMLEELVDYARVASSGRNAQAIKYCLVTDEKMCDVVFQHIKWAAALPDWPVRKKAKNNRLHYSFRDETIAKNTLWDLGLALQNITMGAVEKGLGAVISETLIIPS
jgi:nitroreductase